MKGKIVKQISLVTKTVNIQAGIMALRLKGNRSFVSSYIPRQSMCFTTPLLTLARAFFYTNKLLLVSKKQERTGLESQIKLTNNKSSKKNNFK